MAPGKNEVRMVVSKVLDAGLSLTKTATTRCRNVFELAA
jgi:hypothetical protein